MGIMNRDEVNPLYVNLQRGEAGTLVNRPMDSSGELDYVSLRVRPFGKGALGLPLKEYEVSGIRQDQIFEVRVYNPHHQSLAEPEIIVIFDPTDPNGPIGKYTEKLNQQLRQFKKQIADLQLDLTTARQEAERSKAGARQQIAADNAVSKRESSFGSPLLDRW
jgi:hypothetical protein